MDNTLTTLTQMSKFTAIDQFFREELEIPIDSLLPEVRFVADYF
jgi:hypothetical protein